MTFLQETKYIFCDEKNIEKMFMYPKTTKVNIKTENIIPPALKGAFFCLLYNARRSN